MNNSGPDFVACTIDELLQSILSIEDMIIGANGSPEHLWYRGQGNMDWPLRPSIQRVNRRSLSENEERGIVNDFYVRASRVTDPWTSRDDYSTWLTKAQHYGIPTRLLDWSASPLVASFFAVEEDVQTDACVWVLRPGALNGRNGHVPCLHPLDSHTAMAMMQSAFINHEEDWLESNNYDVLACYAVGRDPRVFTQQSCFTIHRKRDVKLDDIDVFPEFADMVFRIMIPAGSRESMRFQLNMMGITTGYIYPDLEHISHDLRHNYDLS